jgi:hypothetical protein
VGLVTVLGFTVAELPARSFRLEPHLVSTTPAPAAEPESAAAG